MTSYAKDWLAADMSLRDYFAAQVVGGLIAHPCGDDPIVDMDVLVRRTYEIADALIAGRTKEVEQ